MYIVTLGMFIKAIGEWHNSAETFHSLEDAERYMAFALKMGGAYYRDVQLWHAEAVEYRVDIIVE